MIQPVAGGIVLDVRVIPRAAKSGIAGVRDGALLVRLTAPPVDGAANAELIAIIADALGLAQRAVTLASGDRSRRKRVHVTGLSVDAATARLTGRMPDKKGR
jgi:uncharacterized protein